MSEPSPATSPPKKKKARRINVRTPAVMERVQAEVEEHYRSSVVEKLRTLGGLITIGSTTVRLAKQFGFCYGVERAIDLAYAARRVFADKNIYLIGEIIHNPEVNRQLREMGIKNLAGEQPDAKSTDLGPDDVVIVPAFGAETDLMEQLDKQGCMIVDTTCGDVMSVWKRVRQYARGGKTSIIHGKAAHEETRATASRALGEGAGHYLVILTLEDTDYLCDYIRNGGAREEFLQRFEGGFSEGFDPDSHLEKLGVANQTTMLKGETEELQRRIAAAVEDRDGAEQAAENFQFFDTICGATQERQDALYEMLDGYPHRRRRLHQLEYRTPRGDRPTAPAIVFRQRCRLPEVVGRNTSFRPRPASRDDLVLKKYFRSGKKSGGRCDRRSLVSEQPDRGNSAAHFRTPWNRSRAGDVGVVISASRKSAPSPLGRV